VLPDGVASARMIASDLDGTMLATDKTISPRTRAALVAAHDAGIVIVVATGRQLSTLPEGLDELPVDYIVASNGSLAYRPADSAQAGEVLFTELIQPDTLAAISAYLEAHVPGALLGAARGDGTDFVSEPGYLGLMSDGEKVHDGRHHLVAPRAQIVGEPALKLSARHPRLSSDDLLAILDASGLPGFAATTSFAPFVEIAAEGVTKATGLARLCSMLGIDRTDVVAFGDAKNDIEMVSWAGCGVAMAYAAPELVAVADAQTASCDDDGVARVVEQLL